MGLLGFLLTMTEDFNSQRRGVASRDIGFFQIGCTQTAYTEVVHPDTQDQTRLQVTWPLIVHSLPSVFITDDLISKEHYVGTSDHIKQSETETDFAERLHYMARNCRNVLYNAKLVKRFKQGITDATHSILEYNSTDFLLRPITTSTASNSTL